MRTNAQYLGRREPIACKLRRQVQEECSDNPSEGRKPVTWTTTCAWPKGRGRYDAYAQLNLFGKQPNLPTQTLSTFRTRTEAL